MTPPKEMERPKELIHYADSATRGKPLCGAKMADDLSNVRMNSDHVTCPKCLANLPDVSPVPLDPSAKADPKIDEILKERRAMLGRVRADLNKVSELQAEFERSREQKPKA